MQVERRRRAGADFGTAKANAAIHAPWRLSALFGPEPATLALLGLGMARRRGATWN